MSDEKTGSPSGGPVFFCTFVDASIYTIAPTGGETNARMHLKVAL